MNRALKFWESVNKFEPVFSCIAYLEVIFSIFNCTFFRCKICFSHSWGLFPIKWHIFLCPLPSLSSVHVTKNSGWQYEKSYRRSAGVKMTKSFKALQIYKKMIFLIFGFLAISLQRKEPPEIRWCQNDQIFEDFSDFQQETKGFYFSIFLILYFFWIYG